jgi:hypothetical protein
MMKAKIFRTRTPSPDRSIQVSPPHRRFVVAKVASEVEEPLG